MPDVEDVHAGLKKALEMDAQLIALTQPGAPVEFDLPRQGATGPFVLIRVVGGQRVNDQDRCNYERVLYEITGVEKHSSGMQAAAVAKRAREVIEETGFTATGYRIIRCEIFTDAPPVAKVIDDGDKRWQLRGRVWEVFAAPV